MVRAEFVSAAPDAARSAARPVFRKTTVLVSEPATGVRRRDERLMMASLAMGKVDDTRRSFS